MAVASEATEPEAVRIEESGGVWGTALLLRSWHWYWHQLVSRDERRFDSAVESPAAVMAAPACLEPLALQEPAVAEVAEMELVLAAEIPIKNG